MSVLDSSFRLESAHWTHWPRTPDRGTPGRGTPGRRSAAGVRRRSSTRRCRLRPHRRSARRRRGRRTHESVDGSRHRVFRASRRRSPPRSRRSIAHRRPPSQRWRLLLRTNRADRRRSPRCSRPRPNRSRCGSRRRPGSSSRGSTPGDAPRSRQPSVRCQVAGCPPAHHGPSTRHQPETSRNRDAERPFSGFSDGAGVQAGGGRRATTAAACSPRGAGDETEFGIDRRLVRGRRCRSCRSARPPGPSRTGPSGRVARTARAACRRTPRRTRGRRRHASPGLRSRSTRYGEITGHEHDQAGVGHQPGDLTDPTDVLGPIRRRRSRGRRSARDGRCRRRADRRAAPPPAAARRRRWRSSTSPNRTDR